MKSVSLADRGTFFLVERAERRFFCCTGFFCILISEFCILNLPLCLDKKSGFMYTYIRRVCLSVACHVAERYWHEESPGPAGQDNG